MGLDRLGGGVQRQGALRRGCRGGAAAVKAVEAVARNAGEREGGGAKVGWGGGGRGGKGRGREDDVRVAAKEDDQPEGAEAQRDLLERRGQMQLAALKGDERRGQMGGCERSDPRKREEGRPEEARTRLLEDETEAPLSRGDAAQRVVHPLHGATGRPGGAIDGGRLGRTGAV